MYDLAGQRVWKSYLWFNFISCRRPHSRLGFHPCYNLAQFVGLHSGCRMLAQALLEASNLKDYTNSLIHG